MKYPAQGLLINDSFFTVETDFSNPKIQRVLFGFQPIFSFSKENEDEFRFAIVNLIRMGVTVKRLSDIFHIHRATINSWIRISSDKGMSALVGIKPGKTKITPDIEAYILVKFNEIGFCKHYKNIIVCGVLEHFGLEIHFQSVLNVLKKSGIDLSVKKNNKKVQEDQPVLEPEKHIDHAGLFFVFPFLKQFNLKNLFKNTTSLFKDSTFKGIDYIYTLVLLFCANMISVEENMKNYCDEKMGDLIGQLKLPSLRSFRINLPKIIENMDMEAFQLSLSKIYFDISTKTKELYIDGHFMSYHGLWNIFKGYNPIRRIGMKGRNLYFVNDGNGRPVYHILSNGYKDFREYLLVIVDKLKGIIGPKIKETILIFDRGGYGKEFLKKLSSKILFICWQLGKNPVPDNAVWTEVILTHQGNEYGHEKNIIVKATERITEKKQKCEREIWIEKDGKISPAFSNDKERKLPELVKILLARWGCQENVFKPLKEMGIDKISSYEVNEYPDDWLQEEDEKRECGNPMILILKEKIGKIKKAIQKLKEIEGTKALAGKETDDGEIKALLKELKKLVDEKNKLPEKIDIMELIRNKHIIKLNEEKKTFLDIIKILSYNVQQDIVSILRPVYKNQRDINMFVRQILKKDGKMRMGEKEVTIVFEKYGSLQKTNALEFLCEEINKMNFSHPLLGKKVKFIVS